jgi:hypothetical protein
MKFLGQDLAYDYKFINYSLLKVYMYMEQGDKLNMKSPHFSATEKGNVVNNS